MLYITRKIFCVGALLALRLFDRQGLHVQASSDFNIVDVLSLNWLEEFTASREKSTDIEFEAFDAEPKKETTDAEKSKRQTVVLFGGDISAFLPPGFRRQYCYFLIFCICIFIYAFLGKSRNDGIMQHILELQKPLLEEAFAYVADQPKCFERLRWHKYRTYASGRTSCVSLTMNFDLVKRQCVWHELLLTPLLSLEDVMTVEVTMPKMEPIALAITRKLTNKSFIKDNMEIANTMYVYNTADIPSTHRAYINSTEKCATKYAEYIIAACQDFMPQLIALYIVDEIPDVNGYVPENKMTFKVSINNDPKLAATVLETIIQLVDYTKNYSVLPKTKELILKTRKAMVATIYKDEIKKQQEEAREEAREEDPAAREERLKKLEKKSMSRPKRRVTGVDVPEGLKQNIEHLKQLHEKGCTINANIEQSVEFKNPYLLEAIFNIKEYSSNYSKHIYDPDYYEALVNQPDPDDDLVNEIQPDESPTKENEPKQGRTRRGRSGWSPETEGRT
ncbi:uncharacterized protein BXIN_1313 [Babesia sp. Xinjiang]|uniref:uncharacterized protein n=1 Tax=Babesia sp. Xinjiang TaxID=462227 RepID=UPI000A229D4F|nr:uncharacterized protein BXIN_1313 [Babesia sp. Xinjiang]ORM40196.1 hypothetical protein BXIN_1313 [Babesia sp. Xinjiang]